MSVRTAGKQQRQDNRQQTSASSCENELLNALRRDRKSLSDNQTQTSGNQHLMKKTRSRRACRNIPCQPQQMRKPKGAHAATSQEAAVSRCVFGHNARCEPIRSLAGLNRAKALQTFYRCMPSQPQGIVPRNAPKFGFSWRINNGKTLLVSVRAKPEIHKLDWTCLALSFFPNHPHSLTHLVRLRFSRPTTHTLSSSIHRPKLSFNT